MQIKDALKWGHESLLLSSSSSRLDAELLLAHVLQRPVTFLLAHDETEIGWWRMWRYRRLTAKRKEGMPVAYLTGHKEFYFLDFEVNRHVLVPRPDTETLVEAVISYIQENRKQETGNRFILSDVGTGSGCIVISVIKNVEGLMAIATDISRPALRVAKHNAKRHGVYDRIQFIHSDLLANVPLERLKKYNAVMTANLPYIPLDFTVNPELRFEPNISLYGGQDGMEIYKRLMDQVKILKPRAIFLECFEFQKAILATHLQNYELKRTENMTGQAKMLFLEHV